MDNEYLYNELNNNINLKVLQISHNSYFPHIQKLISHYNNFNVQMFMNTLDLEIKKTLLLDFDLIIFYSHNNYNNNELKYLEQLAFYISNKLKKRITIGYSYNPLSGHTLNSSLKDEIELISFNEDEIISEKIKQNRIISIIELLDITLNSHDNYNNKKRKILK